MIGKVLAHYEVTGLLGKGGMGEVYRARDTRLKRDVALKILPPAMAADPLRLRRFQREAETVAALNHPHIVTIFSVEEDAGVRFLTMELVEGRTLDRHLAPGGLPLPEVLDTGAAVADALAAAHEKGILHRDLKPANVMVTPQGRVKVLDFGLAKFSGAPAAESEPVTGMGTITTEGAVLGTLPYMSPEQLRGQEIDLRSDIFSLGVLLHELATGCRPFRGGSVADLITSILNEKPPPVTQLRPDLPRDLERIVGRCLEKGRSARYRSAGDVRDELSRLRRGPGSGAGEAATKGIRPAALPSWRSGRRTSLGVAVAAVIAAGVFLLFPGRGTEAPPPAPEGQVAAGERSIAVLPFVNMSPDPGEEYFSDGLSEELLNLLTRVTDLRVAARTSSFSFKGRNLRVPEIAERLNVAYLLEGSVRKSGDRVRITAQLVRAGDGFHVWSVSYDRTVADLFAIQDEIAADVVKQLQATLLGDAPRVRRTDPEAYALYLQSVHLARRSTPEGFAESDALLHRVLEIDSVYTPAWVGLAANYGNRALAGLVPPEEGFARAREANRRALAIDPRYAPAYAGLAFIAMYGESDFAAAANYLEHAASLDPANARVLGNSASLLNLLGRKEEALALRQAIAVRDAVNVNAIFNLGTSQLNAGRFEEAIGSFRTVLGLSPGNGVAHFQLGVARLLGGDPAGALTEFERETVPVFRMIGLPMAYHALGRPAESDAALAGLTAEYAEVAAYNIAGVHAFRRDPDAAFAWLEQERRNGGTFAEIVLDPLFANLYEDPRWLPFLRGIGKAPEQLARIPFRVSPSPLEST